MVGFGGALFGGLFAFLRFEANLLLNPLGSYSLELLESFVKGPFVSGLVAHIESELLCGEDVLPFKDAGLLETQSAHAKPFVVGQALYENAFGFGLRLVFGLEGGAKFVEFVGIFIREEEERFIVMAETVLGAVPRRLLLARFGSGTGGTMSVRLVCEKLCDGGHGLIL